MTTPDAGYDAILLAGFGGPEGQDDVLPFLRNVTRGRGIPDERLEEVATHYRAMGGVSPINDQNRALLEALRAELADRSITLPVFWGNRNWDPYFADAVDKAKSQGRVRLLAIATSAYSSYSGCRQYREDFAKALIDTDSVGTVTIDKIRPYFDQPGFLDPFVDSTAGAVRKAIDSGFTPDEIEVVFCTHSIPDSMADTSGSATLGDHRRGGAYVTQHLAVAQYVIDRIVEESAFLQGIRWQLAYQSRSGAPTIPWLEPDVNDVLKDIAADGRRAVVCVPIGFVSDHMEVIWDLDTEAAETAADLDLAFWRVPTPGVDPRFVTALVDLVAERLGCGLPREPVLPVQTRPNFCAPGCCVNGRGVRPTTGAQDSASDWAAARETASSGAAGGPRS